MHRRVPQSLPRARLVPRTLLDPRPAEEAQLRPIRGGVNIPVTELPRRVHELPPRGCLIEVAAETGLAERTIRCLRTLGRDGRAAAFEHAADARTAAGEADVGRLWSPNAFLAEVLPNLAPRSRPLPAERSSGALDLACGCGREAVFLATEGWRVTAVDVLEDALELGRDLERRYRRGGEGIEWRRANLESEPIDALAGRFDLVCVFRFLHRPLMGQLGPLVRDAGGVVCETFTTLHRERHGKPARDEHVLRPGELQRFFEGWGIRHYSEAWRGDAHTARVWATKRRGR
jgi:tellurite methyltransferase